MSGPPRIRSSNVPATATVKEQEAESRQILGPTGNNKGTFVVTTTTIDTRKSPLKQQQHQQQQQQAGRAKVENRAAETAERIECGGGNDEVEKSNSKVPSTNTSPRRRGSTATTKTMKNTSVLLLRSNSMSPSCSFDASSSDASSPRSSSRSSTTTAGRTSRSGKSVVSASGSVAAMRRKQQCVSQLEKVAFNTNGVQGNSDAQEAFVDVATTQTNKRCAWITHNTDSGYIAFHDEEWGVPVHDDRMLFELLSLSGALAELTWPIILNKRHLLREVFLDFDPFAVSKLNDKKIVGPGNSVSSFLSEAKLRSILENAKQMCKIIEEFGSFDKYIWNFVNHMPIVSHFRYPRQVPTKTSKADIISKDLVKRGFRSVGPTTIYAFMQVSGLTNDHLISCFRFHDCTDNNKDDHAKTNPGKKVKDGTSMTDSNATVSTDVNALARKVDDLGLSGQ